MVVLAACLLSLAIVPVQEPRTPVPVTSTLAPLPYHLEVASTADRVVSTWRSSGSESIFLAQSDGRGVSWSQPLELDVTPGTAAVKKHELAALEDAAWIAWDDTRFHPGAGFGQPTSAPFLRPIDLTTGALGAEVALPVMGPIDVTETRVLALEAAQVAGEVHVHVLLYSQHFTDGVRSLALASSHDAGVTFPFVQVVATGLLYYQDEAALLVDGQIVHVAYEGGDVLLGPLQVRYQRSSDGGASLDLAPTAVLFEGADLGLVALVAAAGSGSVVVSWADQEVISSDPFDQASRVRAVVSMDGGSSFSAAAVLDDVVSPYLRLFPEAAFVEPAPGNAVVTWGEVNIDVGSYNVSWRTTADGGASWLPPGYLMGGGGNGYSALIGDPGRGRIVAVRSLPDPFGFSGFDRSVAAVSHDAGVHFDAPFDLAPLGHVTHAAAYNGRYQNVVAMMRPQAATELVAGGVRPQTLHVDGFAAGTATIQASFAHFDDGNGSVWLLASLATGDLALPFGDGRNVGLALTPLLLDTISTPAAFLTTLDPTGAATLPPLIAPVPAGIAVHFAALTIDLATLEFGDVSDVRTEES